jgi:aspartyl-tRNA(Asn)/glutamyl-tRNA(Gln) amidotransferase subunit C
LRHSAINWYPATPLLPLLMPVLRGGNVAPATLAFHVGPPATRACESTTAALFVTAITMSLKDFDVEYVAELARIKLTRDEINTFESQLGQVLEHVAKLNELDVSQVEPMAHSFPIYNVFRGDELRESLDREAALANAPHQAQGLFIVTKVVE